jgi:hypothetical protein
MNAQPVGPTTSSVPGAPRRVLELDGKRIERALRQRVRYRYVQPAVERADGGWIVTSPCCSRNIDPTGGVIDIAWLEPVQGAWLLYFKDHAQERWVLHDQADRLQPLLDEICVDPQRVFWP